MSNSRNEMVICLLAAIGARLLPASPPEARLCVHIHASMRARVRAYPVPAPTPPHHHAPHHLWCHQLVTPCREGLVHEPRCKGSTNKRGFPAGRLLPPLSTQTSPSGRTWRRLTVSRCVPWLGARPRNHSSRSDPLSPAVLLPMFLALLTTQFVPPNEYRTPKAQCPEPYHPCHPNLRPLCMPTQGVDAPATQLPLKQLPV